MPQASPARAKSDGYAWRPRFEGGCTVHFQIRGRLLVSYQSINLAVIRLTAMRHITKEKPTRPAKRIRSTQA